MVFITAGMGGGTGTGGAPVVGASPASSARSRSASSPSRSASRASGGRRRPRRASSCALHEINDASSLIQEEAHEDANIIFGAVIDESMGDELRITVIATGFGTAEAMMEPEPVAVPVPAIAVAGSRPVAAAAIRSFGPESIRRVGASDRPVRRVGRVVDEGGEPRIQACEDDANVPDGPAEFTIDPLSDEDAEHDYESPAFLRRAK